MFIRLKGWPNEHQPFPLGLCGSSAEALGKVSGGSEETRRKIRGGPGMGWGVEEDLQKL